MRVVKNKFSLLTETLRKPAIASMLKSIAQHPFLQELAAGALSFDNFTTYITQDLIYLDVYHACFERLIDICPYDDHIPILETLKAEIGHERHFLWHWLSDQQPTLPQTHINIATQNYTRYLCDHINMTYAHGITALFPCAWVYGKIAHILINSAQKDSPYLFWIHRYTDPAFDSAIDSHHYLAESALADSRNKSLFSHELTMLLTRGIELEKDFWAACYRTDRPQALSA
ncbi:MAG: TenA family protein [Alphaproteobacteria bacterium]|nr:TenA family protein [Alphaproteobacteria bacterium]OJV45409.1 MAG: hypothetical protein BGO28_01990 [Alphaproteobacteria bacterium 43-37]